MACGLSDDELFILYVLYTNRCLAKNRSFHSKKLEHLYKKKLSSNFQRAIKNLLKRYITPIKKQELKYYISDIKMMSFALDEHGYSVTKGRERPL
jgi:hypothetical protein